MSEQANVPKSAIWTCPWCVERQPVKDGRFADHRCSYMYPDAVCPCSGLTLQEARDKTDESIAHHAATGE